MWPDNETDEDLLNFVGVADTVAEIVVQANGRPISIGVSGAWGAGKSSMIKLIRRSLVERDKADPAELLYVEFNPWLYQGYDDARASLVEVIATTLAYEAQERKKGADKARDLLARVDWLRAAKLLGTAGLSIALGVPPVGVVGDVYQLGRNLFSNGTEKASADEIDQVITDVSETGGSLVRKAKSSSPPREIQGIRDNFEETLKEMGVRLVVLIDDLDRCLPETTISTLEAIRLLLFLENTAFVIAADTEMIKHAVRSHFGTYVSESLVTNYFDKLIQVPIRVPPLGIQEVRAYMMLLFIENSALSGADKSLVRAEVAKKLSETWKGARVDRAFVQSVIALPPELVGRLDTAERLAPLMTSVSEVGGNPRLIKRFLNALSIRMTISSALGVGVDEAALAKMLLFERCASSTAFDALAAAVSADPEGKPRLLAQWETDAIAGMEPQLPEGWDSAFIREWITVPPRLADLDLRGLLYVSREHAPLVSAQDRLSSDGAEILAAIIAQPAFASALVDRLRALPRTEVTVIMDKILDEARPIQEWGTPPILEAALTVGSVDPTQGARLAAFLEERPPSQIRPGIVPKIAAQPWAPGVFGHWRANSGVAGNVKTAITREAGR